MPVLLGPLVLFAAAMCLTPWPNVIMVTASAANFGFRRAIPHMLGVTLGFGLLIMTVGIGLAGVFHTEPRVHTFLKYVGAAYLFYLAWRMRTLTRLATTQCEQGRSAFSRLCCSSGSIPRAG
jgi:threonine/homoserine/homoserine lactone efflux protein